MYLGAAKMALKCGLFLNVQSKQPHIGRKFAQSGVDVMITIFCDFRQFSAKKLAFFSKNNVMITIFAKTISSLSKNANFFAKFFGENI
jgi:hypothetical protein